MVEDESNDDSVEHNSKREDDGENYHSISPTFHFDDVGTMIHQDLDDSGVDVEAELVRQFQRNIEQHMFGLRDKLKFGEQRR